MPPLFSVVIPTFNRSDLFPYAVKSILNQTFQDFEIVLSDNCSGDDTREVARQFEDARFKYACTPRHLTIADSWEFARMQASGSFIIMLSDDDALVSRALERYAAEIKDPDGDFLFSNVAEYRDGSFPGEDKNSLSCPRFSGSCGAISADEFVRTLFSFQPKFVMHPSAFAFPKKIAEYVESRTGRFFWTNGVEYSAWPITALFSKRMVYVDLPLTILGRTGKSWGSNISLCNPGKEKIQSFIKDVDHGRKHAPLHNFTMVNLMAEGMLTAKNLFSDEFAPYEFDEFRYLKSTIDELRRRQAMGVDVTNEIDETFRYAGKYPSRESELRAIEAPIEQKNDRLRKLVGYKVSKRIRTFQLSRKLTRGEASRGFRASGSDFSFSDILGCSQFLEELVPGMGRNSFEASAPVCPD